MLSSNYSDYVWTIFFTGLQSVTGIAGIALLIAALALIFLPIPISDRLRRPVLWALFPLAALCLATAFYTTIYVFDEDPEALITEFAIDSPVCGAASTLFLKAGYGFANPCNQKGCTRRGLTLRKEMRMTGFPPWPEYRTEFQCLTR